MKDPTDDTCMNSLLWLILMIAAGIAFGWLGFVVAVIGAGFMLLEKVEA